MSAQKSLVGVALANRSFGLLWIGQAVSQLGDRLFLLAVMVYAYDLTRSAVGVSLVLAAAALPSLLFGLPAGALADRWDRKRVMVAADVLSGGLMLLLTVVREPSVIHLYLVVFAVGSIQKLFTPAFNATIPNVVPADDLVAANALVATTRQMAFVAGPALGGVLVGAFGVEWAFVINAISFWVGAIATTLAAVPARRSQLTPSHLSMEVREGLAFLWSEGVIRKLLGVALLVSAAVGINNALILPFAVRVLGLEAPQFGLIVSAFGIGTIVGALATGRLAALWGPPRRISWSLAVAGAALSVFPMVQTLSLALVLRGVIGLGLTGFNISYLSMLQQAAPDTIRGRVIGTFFTLEELVLLVAMIGAGVLGERLGVAGVLAAAGALVLIAWALSLRGFGTVPAAPESGTPASTPAAAVPRSPRR
jgi:MFS family permease